MSRFFVYGAQQAEQRAANTVRHRVRRELVGRGPGVVEGSNVGTAQWEGRGKCGEQHVTLKTMARNPNLFASPSYQVSRRTHWGRCVCCPWRQDGNTGPL